MQGIPRCSRLLTRGLCCRLLCLCVRVCVLSRVHACARACVCVCARARTCACVCLRSLLLSLTVFERPPPNATVRFYMAVPNAFEIAGSNQNPYDNIVLTSQYPLTVGQVGATCIAREGGREGREGEQIEILYRGVCRYFSRQALSPLRCASFLVSQVYVRVYFNRRCRRLWLPKSESKPPTPPRAYLRRPCFPGTPALRWVHTKKPFALSSLRFNLSRPPSFRQFLPRLFLACHVMTHFRLFIPPPARPVGPVLSHPKALDVFLCSSSGANIISRFFPHPPPADPAPSSPLFSPQHHTPFTMCDSCK